MATKQYASGESYEKKLHKVMERLGVKDFNYNWDRFSCYVEFRYKNDLYRFDHTLEKAKTKGINLKYGSDVFAQVVLALEDLARMVERGIYDLSTWVSGMKYLPAPVEIPSFFQFLGFAEIPASQGDVDVRYKTLAKQMHPDAGGETEDFQKLKNAAEQAKKYLETVK